jgi:hypothetical protein
MIRIQGIVVVAERLPKPLRAARPPARPFRAKTRRAGTRQPAPEFRAA